MHCKSRRIQWSHLDSTEFCEICNAWYSRDSQSIFRPTNHRTGNWRSRLIPHRQSYSLYCVTVYQHRHTTTWLYWKRQLRRFTIKSQAEINTPTKNDICQLIGERHAIFPHFHLKVVVPKGSILWVVSASFNAVKQDIMRYWHSTWGVITWECFPQYWEESGIMPISDVCFAISKNSL